MSNYTLLQLFGSKLHLLCREKQHLSVLVSSSIDPERRWGHWQVVPGASPASQTVSDLATSLTSSGVEPERRRYTRHQLWPAVRCCQTRTGSVLHRSKLSEHVTYSLGPQLMGEATKHQIWVTHPSIVTEYKQEIISRTIIIIITFNS